MSVRLATRSNARQLAPARPPLSRAAERPPDSERRAQPTRAALKLRFKTFPWKGRTVSYTRPRAAGHDQQARMTEKPPRPFSVTQEANPRLMQGREAVWSCIHFHMRVVLPPRNGVARQQIARWSAQHGMYRSAPFDGNAKPRRKTPAVSFTIIVPKTKETKLSVIRNRIQTRFLSAVRLVAQHDAMPARDDQAHPFSVSSSDLPTRLDDFLLPDSHYFVSPSFRLLTLDFGELIGSVRRGLLAVKTTVQRREDNF
ncbi:hypothetical protein E5Q_04531 [Mixia osmundae IAM 14324]|uniref:Uncharacterized protein n=1 Tax=Mixia osmundae (strain CBS 9802 / IAM 14324 / JCM 22182 / KY 12970) TaxID=764103 RepID=G7E4U1_MIXOS|nr:hypothetical protein E5Q_04531 [Mixia osmundae IAM 14324]